MFTLPSPKRLRLRADALPRDSQVLTFSALHGFYIELASDCCPLCESCHDGLCLPAGGAR